MKITNDDLKDIVLRIIKGDKLTDIANDFRVTLGYISKIKSVVFNIIKKIQNKTYTYTSFKLKDRVEDAINDLKKNNSIELLNKNSKIGTKAKLKILLKDYAIPKIGKGAFENTEEACLIVGIRLSTLTNLYNNRYPDINRWLEINFGLKIRGWFIYENKNKKKQNIQFSKIKTSKKRRLSGRKKSLFDLRKEFYSKKINKDNMDRYWNERILISDRCECCGKEKAKHVHHSRYIDEAPYEEQKKFLILLCEWCHQRATDKRTAYLYYNQIFEKGYDEWANSKFESFDKTDRVVLTI